MPKYVEYLTTPGTTVYEAMTAADDWLYQAFGNNDGDPLGGAPERHVVGDYDLILCH